MNRHLTPARVVVTKSGLTQVPDEADSGTTISYGLVLVTRSPDEAARVVDITVNLLTAAGSTVATDTQWVTTIPAGGTYFVGNEVYSSVPTEVTHLAANLKVTRSVSRSSVAQPLRMFSSLQTLPMAASSSMVTWRIKMKRHLSALSPIWAVFFDGGGDVIGGGLTFPPSELPPGTYTTFGIDTGPGGPKAGDVSQVQVSMDGNYG